MVIPLIVLTGYGITQSFLWLKSKTKLYGALSIMYLVLSMATNDKFNWQQFIEYIICACGQPQSLILDTRY